MREKNTKNGISLKNTKNENWKKKRGENTIIIRIYQDEGGKKISWERKKNFIILNFHVFIIVSQSSHGEFENLSSTHSRLFEILFDKQRTQHELYSEYGYKYENLTICL